MIKILLQGLVVIGLAALAHAWYGMVMPPTVAMIMALLIGGFAAFSMLSGNLRFSRALLGGAVFVVWPVGVLLAQEAAGWMGARLTEHEALAAAWPAALLAGKGSFALAEKRDRARDIGNLSLGVIAIYTAWVATWSGQPMAMMFAALGVAAISANARQQIILPPQHKKFMSMLAQIAAGAAIMLLVRVALFGR